jgi:hypothetical protein
MRRQLPDHFMVKTPTLPSPGPTSLASSCSSTRREWERLNRPLWTEGSIGQLVEHPLIRTMDRLDRASAASGAALRLDPASAHRLGRMGQIGRPVGANSAPDRWLPAPFPASRISIVGEPPLVLRRDDSAIHLTEAVAAALVGLRRGAGDTRPTTAQSVDADRGFGSERRGCNREFGRRRQAPTARSVAEDRDRMPAVGWRS